MSNFAHVTAFENESMTVVAHTSHSNKLYSEYIPTVMSVIGSFVRQVLVATMKALILHWLQFSGTSFPGMVSEFMIHRRSPSEQLHGPFKMDQKLAVNTL